MSPDRRQLNRERTIAAILDTARAIMREQGVSALSMHEIARRMDMRAPSLYNYFGSRHEIYDALFRRGFSDYLAYWGERVAGVQTWQELIGCHLESYMSWALENPELYQLCFERPVPGFVPSPESLAVSQEGLRDGYRLAEGLLGNLGNGLSPESTVDLILAVAHGLTALHLANEPELPLGQGRFGSLISAGVSLFEKAWNQSVDDVEKTDE